jgi:hypothetical protein
MGREAKFGDEIASKVTLVNSAKFCQQRDAIFGSSCSAVPIVNRIESAFHADGRLWFLCHLHIRSSETDLSKILVLTQKTQRTQGTRGGEWKTMRPRFALLRAPYIRLARLPGWSKRNPRLSHGGAFSPGTPVYAEFFIYRVFLL